MFFKNLWYTLTDPLLFYYWDRLRVMEVSPHEEVEARWEGGGREYDEESNLTTVKLYFDGQVSDRHIEDIHDFADVRNPGRKDRMRALFCKDCKKESK